MIAMENLMARYMWWIVVVFCVLFDTPLNVHSQVDEQNLKNIEFSEILADPNGDNDFDTDGNGTADTNDEFVELHNNSTTPIDISGWQLWDKGNGLWFEFPPNTILKGNRYVVVIADIAEDGQLPTTDSENLAFSAGRGGNGVLNNGGDNIVLYAPNEDSFRQLVYGNADIDDPTTYDGFSTTATRLNNIENWGRPAEGVSLIRSTEGDTQTVLHTLYSEENASPGAPTNPVERLDPLLNEFVADHEGPDTHEYIEILGDPNTDYSTFTIIQLEGDPDDVGRIDSVHTIGTTDDQGLWITDFFSSRLENGALTLLIVEGFFGRVGNDSDENNDGVLDVNYWVRIVDSVAINTTQGDDILYSDTIFQRSEDMNSGGASRIGNQWLPNNYAGMGLPCCGNAIVIVGQVPNTPNAPNTLE